MYHSLVLKLPLLIENPFVERFKEGGPFFMTLILICLLLVIYFLIRAFRSRSKNRITSKKMSALAVDAGLLGLVFGFFSSVVGFIEAFDSIDGIGQMNSVNFATALKMTFLSTLFGCFVFIISRIGVLVYKWTEKVLE